MFDRRLDARHNAHCKSQITIFGVPFGLAYELDFGTTEGTSRWTSTHLDSAGAQSLEQYRQELRRDGFINQNRFNSVAGYGSLGLGIKDQGSRHLLIRRTRNVDSVHAIRVANDGNAGIRKDESNQIGTAS